MSAPSGTQFELRFGSQHAVVVEVGAALREYEVNGQPVLDGFPVDRMADGGRGQPLLPWPNRLGDGRYEWSGEVHQLPVDEVSRGNATHGLTRWLGWTPVAQSAAHVQLSLRLHPRPGYPFTLDLLVHYLLDDAGLSVRMTARNSGVRALPFGAGQHPYFTVGLPLVDSTLLTIPAQSRLELDDVRRLPTGRILPVTGSSLDFRKPRQIGSQIIDDCFTDLARDADGRARTSLTNPSTGATVTVWMDARYRYVQAFSGDTLTSERRRRSMAIEPMTCPPDAFRTGADLIVLQPEETCTLEWGACCI